MSNCLEFCISGTHLQYFLDTMGKFDEHCMLAVAHIRLYHILEQSSNTFFQVRTHDLQDPCCQRKDHGQNDNVILPPNSLIPEPREHPQRDRNE